LNEPRSVRRLGLPLLVLPMLLASLAFSPSPSGASPAVPEGASASAADVASGLHKIQDIAVGVAGAVVGRDEAKAEQLHGDIEPEWQKIEDTIRAHDKDAYAGLEDTFTQLKVAAKAADAAGASKASYNVAVAVKSYLSKHPSDAKPAAAETPGSPREASSADAAQGTSPALARTGSRSSLLTAFAGMALGLGGLALIGGARRRARRPAGS